MTQQVVVRNNSNGIGVGTILFLLFLTLKLVGVIAWSWWWVTAPLWIPVGLVALVIGATLPVFLLKQRK